MSEFTSALEGALAVIAGGIVLLMFASAVGSTGYLNLPLLGVMFTAIGVVLLIGVVIAGVVALIRGIA